MCSAFIAKSFIASVIAVFLCFFLFLIICIFYLVFFWYLLKLLHIFFCFYLLVLICDALCYIVFILCYCWSIAYLFSQWFQHFFPSIFAVKSLVRFGFDYLVHFFCILFFVCFTKVRQALYLLLYFSGLDCSFIFFFSCFC